MAQCRQIPTTSWKGDCRPGFAGCTGRATSPACTMKSTPPKGGLRPASTQAARRYFSAHRRMRRTEDSARPACFHALRDRMAADPQPGRTLTRKAVAALCLCQKRLCSQSTPKGLANQARTGQGGTRLSRLASTEPSVLRSEINTVYFLAVSSALTFFSRFLIFLFTPAKLYHCSSSTGNSNTDPYTRHESSQFAGSLNPSARSCR